MQNLHLLPIYLILTGDIFTTFSLLTPLVHALTARSRQSSLLFSCDQPSAMGSFSKAHQDLQAFSTLSNEDIQVPKHECVKYSYSCMQGTGINFVWHLTNRKNTDLMNRIVNACILTKTPKQV